MIFTWSAGCSGPWCKGRVANSVLLNTTDILFGCGSQQDASCAESSQLAWHAGTMTRRKESQEVRVHLFACSCVYFRKRAPSIKGHVSEKQRRMHMRFYGEALQYLQGSGWAHIRQTCGCVSRNDTLCIFRTVSRKLEVTDRINLMLPSPNLGCPSQTVLYLPDHENVPFGENCCAWAKQR